MYPSLYYAFKDLFGISLPFLKPFQSFGFFVAMAFITGAYLWQKELKRKENEGLLQSNTIKTLKGKPATNSELILSAIVGFLLGFKLVYIVFNFSEFSEDTQSALLSARGSVLGGIAVAAISCFLRYREKQKTKLPEPQWIEEIQHPWQQVGNLTLLAALFGMIGAKIFHNLENFDEFTADPWGSLFSFSGLTMYGGLICASVACIWYGHYHKIPVRHLIDSAAPSLMISYGVGRIGCQVAGDGDWGIVSINPKPSFLQWLPDWMWSYDYAHNVNSIGVPIENCMAERYCNHLVPPVFPTPFYETLMCAFLFVVLWKIRKRITTPGVLFCTYLILNGIERNLIEKIRVNTLYHIGNFGFTQAELISTILIITGVCGIFYFRKKNAPIIAANN